MEQSLNPDPECTEMPQPFISMHPFSDVPSFLKISRLTV